MPGIPACSSLASTEQQAGFVNEAQAAPSTPARSSFFIGNAIANLRNLDPAFCGRTLTLVDGRRGRLAQEANFILPPGAVPITATPPGLRDRWVQVWLLKADGTQFEPVSYACEAGSRISKDRTDVSISHGYFIPENDHPVAASIRVGDAFYIEKLEPLASAPAVQYALDRGIRMR